MPDVLSGLIWVQIVCKCNQQTTLLSKELMTTIQANYSTCADPGIFVRGGGGVQVNLTKKALTTFSFSFSFLVLSLFYRSQMVIFKEIYHFSKFQRWSNIFQGESNFFQGGGGSNCLYRIETHITCDFPGGVRTPFPPLDPHLLES